MRLIGLLGSVRLPKGYAEVLKSDNSLTKVTQKIAGKIKTSFKNSEGTLVGTITEGSDGRTITKVIISKDRCYNGPAEEVLRAMGFDMKPRTEAQKNLQKKYFNTANTNTGRLQNGVDVEVVHPNGKSNQYFYERGVYAWDKSNPEAYLDSSYNISGKLTHQGGDGPFSNKWLMEDMRIVDQQTGMERHINKPHQYTEWADD